MGERGKLGPPEHMNGSHEEVSAPSEAATSDRQTTNLLGWNEIETIAIECGIYEKIEVAYTFPHGRIVIAR